jgi:taurine dioxygenase
MFQDHIILNPHVMRWHWTQGDVAIWDNAATQHAAVNDWGDQPRVVRRWTVGGDVPVSVDGRRSVAVQVPGS